MKVLHFAYNMSLKFDAPVEKHRFTLKCKPRSGERQEITWITANVYPNEFLSNAEDSFGNSCIYGYTERKHDHFSVNVIGTARTGLAPWETAGETHRIGMFRYQTPYTMPGPHIKEFAERFSFGEDTPSFEKARAFMTELYRTLACAGSEVESISFERLGQNSEVNIVVRYTLLNQSEKAFSVYSYEDRTPIELYSSTYVCLDVFDINNDGADELITVSYDKALQNSTAMMFTDGENGFEKLSQTDLYGGTSDYIRVTEGKVDEQTSALFLDYSKGGGISGTDVLYCADNQLFCPYGVGNTIAVPTIQRVTNDYMSDIFCCDIDGDGFVEVPNTKLLPGYETTNKNEQLYAIEWYTVAYSKYALEHYSYVSSKYYFALLFPSRWLGVVTAVADFTNNEIVFISYDEHIGLNTEFAHEILRIRAVDKDDKEGLKDAQNLTFIGETDETYYCIKQQDGRLALTESELQNCFKML